MRTAEERLIAVATHIGLRKSVMLLQGHLSEHLSEVLRQSPVEDLQDALRHALGLDETPAPRPKVLPAKSLARVSKRDDRPAQEAWHNRASLLAAPKHYAPKKRPYPGPANQTARIEHHLEDGEYHIIHLSDGRVWRSKRRRDLVLRARKAGFSIEV